MLVIVVGLAGFTVRPGQDDEARRELERARELLDRREVMQQDLQAFDPEERVQAASSLRQELRRLIPHDLSRVEAFNLLRMAAARAHVHLDAVELQAETDTELLLDDETVVMLRVKVTAKATLDGLVAMVSALRGMGVPTAVLRFSVSRDRSTDSDFRVDALLGLFYYTAPRVSEDSEGLDDA